MKKTMLIDVRNQCYKCLGDLEKARTHTKKPVCNNCKKLRNNNYHRIAKIQGRYIKPVLVNA